jgi:HD-like signal output (HDOD) protein/CheY-like chemotaxis protein
MNPRIIFVDDEPNVIDGLRRMLRPFRHRWDLAFATSGSEALQLMEQRTYDVIVSDMRMPGMDGCQLLEQVEKRDPQIVRVVLSGTAGVPEALGSLRPTHQYLAKPCDADTVKNTIERALKLRELVPQDKVCQLISRNGSVPSLPSLYVQIMQELNSPDCEIGRVADIIARDAGMTAKILQLANSAFFGLRAQVSTPSDAIFRLGLDVVKALALSVQVFSSFETDDVKKLNLTRVWPHSLSTASLARKVAVRQKAEPGLVDLAFTAGLLHDVGKLVLAANIPEEYHEVLTRAAETKVKDWQGEYIAFGVTHAEVGGYLIGLWGLPDNLVEAVAFHHCPARSAEAKFGPLAAVHLADALEHHRRIEEGRNAAQDLDADYLGQVGLKELVDAPQAFLAEMNAGEG